MGMIRFQITFPTNTVVSSLFVYTTRCHGERLCRLSSKFRCENTADTSRLWARQRYGYQMSLIVETYSSVACYVITFVSET